MGQSRGQYGAVPGTIWGSPGRTGDLQSQNNPQYRVNIALSAYTTHHRHITTVITHGEAYTTHHRHITTIITHGDAFA